MRIMIGSALLAFVATTAWARDDPPIPNYFLPNMSAILSARVSSIETQNIVNGTAHHGSKSKGKTGASVSHATTTFTPSTAVAAQVRDQFLQGLRTTSPTNADKIAVTLRQKPIAGVWAGIVSRYGLHANDVSDAVAAQWVINYMIVNDLQDVNPASVRSVRQRLHDSLVRTTTLARTSNTAKQLFAETLYLRFVLLHAAFLNAQKPGNEAYKTQLHEAIRAQFLKENHVDLQTLTLTTVGFREKKP